MKNFLDWSLKSWISSLAPEVEEAVRREMGEIRLRDEEVLFSRGEIAHHLHEIQEGRIKLCSYAANGKESTLGIYGSPMTMSEVSICAQAPYTLTATSVGSSRIGILPAKRFSALRKRYPQIDREILRVVSLRMMSMFNRHEEFSTLGVESRLASRLFSLANSSAQSNKVDDNSYMVQLRQEDLAAMLGVSRQSINRTLRTWESGGLVQLRYGKIILPDPEKLLNAVHEKGATQK